MHSTQNKFKLSQRVRIVSGDFKGKIAIVNAIYPAFFAGKDFTYSLTLENRQGNVNLDESLISTYRSEGHEIDFADVEVGDTITVTHTVDDMAITKTGVVASVGSSGLSSSLRTAKHKVLYAGHWKEPKIVLDKAAPVAHPVDAAKKGESFRLHGGDYVYDYTYTKHLDDLWILDRFELGSKTLYKSVITPADQVKNDWNAHRDYNGAVRTEIGLPA